MAKVDKRLSCYWLEKLTGYANSAIKISLAKLENEFKNLKPGIEFRKLLELADHALEIQRFEAESASTNEEQSFNNSIMACINVKTALNMVLDYLRQTNSYWRHIPGNFELDEMIIKRGW